MDEFKETEWWIDYLENELEPSLLCDLEALLEHSSEDRDSFESFRVLRAWVRDSDPLATVDLETRLRRVHAGVMAEIAKLPAPVRDEEPRRREEELGL
jgi:hypothetical protein